MVHARAIIILLAMCVATLAQPLTTSELAWNRRPSVVVANQLFWIKADFGVYYDLGVTLATNNNSVQQWNDASSNGFNVSYPTVTGVVFSNNILNGLPVVHFSGGVLYRAPVALNQPQTFIGVVRVSEENTNSGSPSVFIGELGGVTFARDIPTDRLIAYLTSPLSPEISGPVMTLNNWHIVSLVINGSSSYLRMDGGDVYSGNLGSGGYTDIGVGGTSSGAAMLGDIAEIVRYSVAHTTNQLNIVESYLRTKWGL